MPTLNYKSNTIHYHQYGTGQSLMIAFHGFADTGALFGHLEGVLGEKYTIVALDLPFHGQSIWEGDRYNGNDIAEIVQQLLLKFDTDKCSLMCHSMGGRLVLALLPFAQDIIKEIFFFATAGTRYTFTASKFWWPLWLRKRSRIKFVDSEFLMSVFDSFEKLKLMNRATYLVFKMQLDLPRRRARLLRTWVAMYDCPMQFGKEHIKIINDKKIPTHFFFGKKDRITPAKYAPKLVNKLNNAELIITKGNHFFVKDKLAPALENYLKTLKTNSTNKSLNE